MKIFHQKIPEDRRNATLAFGNSDENFFCQKSKQFFLGFRNQTNEYIFFPENWSCSKKTVWIPRIPFWRRFRKFFHQKSQVNVFKSRKIFWKRRSKNSSLLQDASIAILTILTKVFSQKNVSWLIFEFIEKITSFLRNI